MSNVSGKCDFKDYLFISSETVEEAFNKFNGTKLYICKPLPDDFSWKEARENNINIPETYYKKVEYSSIKDLIPYYPHTIAFSCTTQSEPRNSVVCLSSESFVDREERERLESYLKSVIRIYNRCKRKKIEFTVEDAVEEVCWGDWNKEHIVEIAKRVKEKGKKANLDGIHLNMHEHYRRDLVAEMKRNGLNPSDYGYSRFES